MFRAYILTCLTQVKLITFIMALFHLHVPEIKASEPDKNISPSRFLFCAIWQASRFPKCNLVAYNVVE